MKLHDSPDVFETIVLRIAEREDIRSDVLEKDYYVTLLLKELSSIFFMSHYSYDGR